jgi:hypothetical protein
VHRECRYFSADRCRAPGAAGVSQPWQWFRVCECQIPICPSPGSGMSDQSDTLGEITAVEW